MTTMKEYIAEGKKKHVPTPQELATKSLSDLEKRHLKYHYISILVSILLAMPMFFFNFQSFPDKAAYFVIAMTIGLCNVYFVFWAKAQRSVFLKIINTEEDSFSSADKKTNLVHF